MMKTAMLLCLLLLPALSFAQEIDVRSVVDTLPVEQMEQAFEDSGVSAKKVLKKMIDGENVLELESVFQKGIGMVREMLSERRGLLLKLLAPILLCAVIGRFQDALGGGSVFSVVRWICFLFVAQEQIRQTMRVCGRTLKTVADTATGMQTVFQPLVTLLSAVGGTGSAAVLQPVVAASASAVIFVCEKVCLPLATAYLALKTLDSLTDGWSLSRVCKLCRQAANLMMGVSLTAFTGVMSICGFTAAARDGVSLRAAKFAVDSFVPEVGGLLSDTAETVAASSLVVKNALGATGVALLCARIAAPLLDVLVTALIFRVASAMAEPFDESRIAECFDAACGAMGILTGCLLSVGAMFMILIAQMVAAGNIIAMLT